MIAISYIGILVEDLPELLEGVEVAHFLAH